MTDTHKPADTKDRVDRSEAQRPGQVIVAADFPTEEALEVFLEKLGDRKPYLKVGMELFYATGPHLVRSLKERGYKIFLDLKLHDIPNTVGSAMAVLSELGVDMVNLHASGGKQMMEAALAGLTRSDGTRPLLIGVTELTSTSKKVMNEELGIPGEVEDSVVRQAKLAQQAGLDGVVCSPLETSVVKEACGEEFLTVTPGIRFKDAKADDQVRVTTPADARKAGSDFIVVGRPITAAPHPAAAYDLCVEQFSGVHV